MAFSSAALSANEIAWAAADKPILGANAAAIATLSVSRWTDTITGVHDTAEINDATKPITRIFDGLPGLPTAPDEARSNYTIYLEFAAAITFDAILYLNHNLYSEGCSALVLQVGDDEDMTNATTVSTLDPSAGSSDARLADLVLEQGGGSELRYTAQFMRVTLAKGSDFEPSIGQIVFLRRRQLSHQPNRPWDTTDQHGSMDSFESQGGVFYDTARYRGRREISADLGQLATGIQSEILAWWSDTNQGTKKFVWLDQPDADPAGFNLMRMDPDLAFPYVLGGGSRDLRLHAVEQGPTFRGIE